MQHSLPQKFPEVPEAEVDNDCAWIRLQTCRELIQAEGTGPIHAHSGRWACGATRSRYMRKNAARVAPQGIDGKSWKQVIGVNGRLLFVGFVERVESAKKHYRAKDDEQVLLNLANSTPIARTRKPKEDFRSS
jgi:hypothetical protein